MRIGIQLLSLRPGQVGGQEVLVRRLLTRIAPMLGGDQIVVFMRPELTHDATWQPALAHPAIETAAARPEEHYGDGYADWSLQILRDAVVDVVFFPLFFFFPRPLPIPVAVHVPDLQHEFCPEYFPPEQLSWRRERIPESVALADAVITGSQFSAGTLRDRLHADPTRLHVIPNGGFLSEEIQDCLPDLGGHHRASPLDVLPVTPPLNKGGQGGVMEGKLSASNEEPPLVPPWQGGKQEDLDSQSRKVNTQLPADLPDGVPFVFYPAADWPHKNHETLLRAMAILAGRGRPEHLVLTGMLSQSGDRLPALADQLGIADRVHFLGCVEQNRLIAIYRRAALMAFPSRFEGFGLPLVEAMQLGCPIVASRAAAVVETAGHAAVFCDDSPEAWADALTTTLDSSDLRADLARRGRTRAADFDWDCCAAQYLALFRTLAAKRH